MITDKQVRALKYLVYKSKYGSDLAKKIFFYLLDKSDNLTKEVCVSLVEGLSGYNNDEIHNAAFSVDFMKSCNLTTHLNEIFDAMGSGFNFSTHYGDFDPNREDIFNSDGMFVGWDRNQVSREGLIKEGMPMRYTFWLSEDEFSADANLIPFTRYEIDSIDLSKHGLYQFLDKIIN